MGNVANEAVIGRRVARTRRLDAAAAAVRGSAELTMTARERTARRTISTIRRAMRGRASAERAVGRWDDVAAAAVHTLLDLGYSKPEVAAACGVPHWTIRRLAALPTDPVRRAGC